jgi:hypothetical protein
MFFTGSLLNVTITQKAGKLTAVTSCAGDANYDKPKICP